MHQCPLPADFRARAPRPWLEALDRQWQTLRPDERQAVCPGTGRISRQSPSVVAGGGVTDRIFFDAAGRGLGLGCSAECWIFWGKMPSKMAL